MKEIEPHFYYLSAKAYSEKTGMGYVTVLSLCKSGELEAFETEGGQWNVKVYKHEAIPKVEFDRIREENTQLKNTIKNIMGMLMQTVQ